MKLRIEQLDDSGKTVRVLYPEPPEDASLRSRWVAFMAAMGFTGNVLAEDSVKAAMLFSAVEVDRHMAVLAELAEAIKAPVGLYVEGPRKERDLERIKKAIAAADALLADTQKGS